MNHTDTKKEERIDKKIHKIYTSLVLDIHKYEKFDPTDIARVVILGMKMIDTVSGMKGHERKERLISIVKLLIREYGEDNFRGYDTNLIFYLIDDLHAGGILTPKTCVMS